MRVKPDYAKPKVNIVTLGCAKNTVDSEQLFTQLKANRFEVQHDSPVLNHQIVVINTCGFIESAKEQSIQTILDYTEAKNDGLVDKVYVTGCLSERYQSDLKKEIPEVDAWYGTRDLSRLLKTMNADYKKELLGERLASTPGHYAFLKIAEGCNRPCSFCAIPLMRGQHHSYPEEQILSEAKKLAAMGTKELVLIAQDLTFYGLDVHGKRTLSELLRKLSDVEGIEWIRLQYAFPTGFPMDVLDVMAERENICNYLDMPLQHGATAVLKRMRRGITREKTEKLVQEIRERVPGIAIRTTMMVGYPGETEAEFEEMLRHVEDMQFDRLGAFTYSHEENTHAFLAQDDVPEEVKEDRYAQLMALQQDISAKLNQEKVGQHLKVMIDREESGQYIGRTAHDSPEVDNQVFIPSEGLKLPTGAFQSIRIKEAGPYDLFGEISI